MIRSVVLIITFIFLINSPIFGEIQLPKPIVTKINEKVYALLGPIGIPSKENRGYMANSTVIIGDAGVILIDTGFTDEIGRLLKSTIAGITDKPVTHIINSSSHKSTHIIFMHFIFNFHEICFSNKILMHCGF